MVGHQNPSEQVENLLLRKLAEGLNIMGSQSSESNRRARRKVLAVMNWR